MMSAESYKEFRETKIVMEPGGQAVRARVCIEWIQPPQPPEGRQLFKASPET